MKAAKRMARAMLTILFSLMLAIPVQAAESDPYDRVLEEVNNAYGTDLQMGYIDKGQVSPEEYYGFIEQVAKNSAETEEAIKNRHATEATNNYEIELYGGSKTVTKDAWGGWGNSFSITARYSTDNMKIIGFNSASVNAKSPINFMYDPNVGSPTYTFIDANRTLTVTFYGTVNNPSYTITTPNVKLYAEFTATS